MVCQILSRFVLRIVASKICRFRTSVSYSTSSTTEIPAIKTNSTTKPTFIYIATATTGFSYNIHDVVQISAIKQGEDKYFNIFIKPRYIPKEATQIHGITYKNGVMKQYDTELTFMPQEIAIKEFVEYLESCRDPIFITHQATLHFQMLYALLNKSVEKSPHLREPVLSLLKLGVVDSLALFRSLYPEKQKHVHKLDNHQLKTIALFILGGEYKFNKVHDAISHVSILKDIFEKMSLSDDEILKHAKQFQDIVNAMTK